MHALLAHLYHLMLHAIHLAGWPIWRALGACLVLAVGGRALIARSANARRAGTLACLAVAGGWAVAALPTSWPPTPLARLPGLALLLLLPEATTGRGRPWLRIVIALLTGWWLTGLPVVGAGLIAALMAALALGAAFITAARLARGDHGWATLAAAAVLAAGLLPSGAAPHWARAACVPAVAAAVFWGVHGAMPALAGLVVTAGAAATVASDGGRLMPVVAAGLVPLLVLGVVPALMRRGTRPVLASGLAACGGVALDWAARALHALP